MLGLQDGYTIDARRLITYAGTDSSGFAKAEKRLAIFCNIHVAENTIKSLCDKEAPKMLKWQENAPVSWHKFDLAEGALEFTTDGTCVNTTEGWKEMRIGIFSKREPGEAALSTEWDSRHLPRPHVAIAFAEIAEKDEFRKRWGYWGNRLEIENYRELSALGDGAPWIWDAVLLEFDGQAQENLDIYHALEYLSGKGDLLFGKSTVEYTVWYDTMKRDLLEGGPKPLLDRLALMDTAEWPKEQKEAHRLLTNYLENHSGRMNYRSRLAAGQSIGSGQVEGACRHMIGARLKQTGAKWRRDRVNRMGVLCSIYYGDQWNDYWKTAK